MLCQKARLVGVAKVFACSLATLGLAQPASAVNVLGSAVDFAVLGGPTVTNTGASFLVGDVGVSPGTAITGLGEATLIGDIHAGSPAALQAQLDLVIAAAALSALAPGTDLSGEDLGGRTLTPGVYSFASTAQLTGILTLDFTSAPAGDFIFLIGSTLTTATGADVIVLGGGAGSGIFWNVGSAATLGTGSTLVGNIIARTAITVANGARILCGRALAITEAVTLDSNDISNNCSTSNIGSGRSDFDSAGFAGLDAVDPLPEPDTWAMLVVGLGGVGAVMRRRRPLAALAAA